MKDLDQATLKRLAHEGPFARIDGVDYVAVERDLLERVTREFDVEHVFEAPRGTRCPR